MEVSALLFYIDALLQIQSQQSDKFTLLCWLLFQELGPATPPQQEALDLEANRAAWTALQQAIDAQEAGIRACVANAADDEAARKCVEPLLTVVETYLPQLFVPADWQVAWMGVET